MNNKEFISTLARDTGYGISDTQRMVTDIIDVMSDKFMDGDSVMISNFGCFEVKKKLERIMINPSTQQRMLVPPKLVLGFKPNTSWKDKLKTESKDK
ncbi:MULTISPECIES: HU family DNA-binding protein [Bacteroides]|jgi:DNA-binding protein HU-beta/integration host factor subunit alpha|uniref:HU family DNA-binding protein n=1 Tax=Bacteroides TaxID=816 RepID=UPI0025B41E2C|nr:MULTISPECIES: HU family DNA-binding protein [Bacteroides]